ncbi:MAG: regulatory protein GemA [Pseudomonadota bacterium]
MTALSALHATRSAASLSEEEARDIYDRVVGKRSTKAMSDKERLLCRDEISRLYPQAGTARRKITGRYAPKIQALWIAAWNLGLVRDRDDKALLAFVKRQTGIDHTRFLIDGQEAAKVIEALKGWMARDTTLEWSNSVLTPPWLTNDRAKVALAQAVIVVRRKGIDADRAVMWLVAEVNQVLAWNYTRIDFAGLLGRVTDEQWIKVMNALGEQVRSHQP